MKRTAEHAEHKMFSRDCENGSAGKQINLVKTYGKLDGHSLG